MKQIIIRVEDWKHTKLKSVAASRKESVQFVLESSINTYLGKDYYATDISGRSADGAKRNPVHDAKGRGHR